MSYDGEIPEYDGKPAFVLTVLHKVDEPISVFGALVGEEIVEVDGHHADASDLCIPA